jgi:predicted PurR-regulated permease PerM
LILCFFIGVLATSGLLIVGVDFALLLGLIAGAFEIFPFVGPILGAIPALIVAALQSPMTALWTLVVFIIIQQIENLFLAPKIAGESVKLHPALVMVVLVVGNEALGLWGMLLAVPLAAVIRDVFKYLYLRFSDEEVSPGEAMARVRTEKMTIEV